LTTNIGDVKLSTNVVYWRNGLWRWFFNCRRRIYQYNEDDFKFHCNSWVLQRI